MVTILCAPDAAVPIKCYSPDLMVHGCLGPEEPEGDLKEPLERLDALVIGPGLGRSKQAFAAVKRILMRVHEKPLVLDGDALFLLAQEPGLLREHKCVVLTPNAMEFRRLWLAAVGPDAPPFIGH